MTVRCTGISLWGATGGPRPSVRHGKLPLGTLRTMHGVAMKNGRAATHDAASDQAR